MAVTCLDPARREEASERTARTPTAPDGEDADGAGRKDADGAARKDAGRAGRRMLQV
jgi:hypothetical protein